MYKLLKIYKIIYRIFSHLTVNNQESLFDFQKTSLLSFHMVTALYCYALF